MTNSHSFCKSTFSRLTDSFFYIPSPFLQKKKKRIFKKKDTFSCQWNKINHSWCLSPSKEHISWETFPDMSVMTMPWHQVFPETPLHEATEKLTRAFKLVLFSTDSGEMARKQQTTNPVLTLFLARPLSKPSTTALSTGQLHLPLVLNGFNLSQSISFSWQRKFTMDEFFTD